LSSLTLAWRIIQFWTLLNLSLSLLMVCSESPANRLARDIQKAGLIQAKRRRIRLPRLQKRLVFDGPERWIGSRTARLK